MKKTAILINTSKGSLIDYDALNNALEENKIAGAALDVFPLEPIDEDNEFINLDNAIITPHIGGNTEEIIKRQSEILLLDIKNWLIGKKPQHLMNPEVFKEGEIKSLFENQRGHSEESKINKNVSITLDYLQKRKREKIIK